MKREPFKELRMTIERLHRCKAVHVVSAPVEDSLDGAVLWKGDIEIFLLIGHPQASRCFGWRRRPLDRPDNEPFVTVLEVPPINSIAAAVRAAATQPKRSEPALAIQEISQVIQA